jgi:predicted metal-dependent hydrolase
MYLTIDNIEYEVVIIRKPIKNLYIRVKDDLKIYVNASRWASINEIKKILNNEIDSIIKMILKQKNKSNYNNLILGEYVEIVTVPNQGYPELKDNMLFIKDESKLDLYYKKLAAKIFNKRLDIIHNIFEEDIPYPTLRIRKMKSRWGVCNRRNNTITINLELLKRKLEYIDYVIIHELSHFVHFNHSKSFWGLVEKYMPNYKKLRKELKE